MRVKLGLLKQLISETLKVEIAGAGQRPTRARNVPNIAGLSASALTRMAKSKDVGIRCLAAGHPNTPPDVLNDLMSDEEVWDWDSTTPAWWARRNPSSPDTSGWDEEDEL